MSPQPIKIAEKILTHLKLKQLRLLVAIGEHQSVLHAANALNTSQPAATKLIKDLETDFQVELFSRTNRGMIPTLYGEALIHHGKLILKQITHAAQELDDLKEGSGGRVVVGTLLSASVTLLPLTIRKVMEEKPNVMIKIVEGTNEVLMPSLRSGDVDLVVGRLPTHRHREKLEQEVLFEEEVICIARNDHPVHNLKNINLDDLIKYSWILPPEETSLRTQIDLMLVNHNHASPLNSVESVSYLANRSLILHSDMIGVVPAYVATFDIDAGLVKQVAWKVSAPISPVGITKRKDAKLPPPVEYFLTTLREVSAQFKA